MGLVRAGQLLSSATFLKRGAHALLGSLLIRAQWPGSEAAGRMFVSACPRHGNDDVPRDPGVPAAAWPTGRLWPARETISAASTGRGIASLLVSHGEIGPARLVGRRPHDGFGLLEIATCGGLGKAARLPSILPPPQPSGRHEDDRAQQADQDEIDSEDQQRPEPHLSHCPHLPSSAAGPSPPVRIPSAVRSNHARDLHSRPGQRRRLIARLLGVSQSTIYLEGFYVSPAEVATS